LKGQLTIINKSSGTTVLGIRLKELGDIKFGLPPLFEQHRIVAKIEELFSDLDVGIESLKTARSQLKIYRQSVLKWAFEGKLTAEWRQEQQRLGRLQSAEELLAQIKVERDNRYQQQVKDWEKSIEVWETNGKINQKPTKPQKPKLLEPLDKAEIANLHSIPRDWCYAKIGEVNECLDSFRIPINKKTRADRKGDVPYYGANGQVGWIDDYLFNESLILVVEDETFVGREIPFSYKISGKSWVNNHAHIIRVENKVHIDFINYQLLYYPFTRLTTGTTGRRKLTQNAFINAPLKICRWEEQIQIVQEIESRLSICDNLEATIEENLQRAESLRQSILKQAFAGKLVPQDLNDEPAAQLLARIQQEQSAQQTLPLKPHKPGKKTL
jgi:type I restriction enzyme, S subunit